MKPFLKLFCSAFLFINFPLLPFNCFCQNVLKVTFEVTTKNSIEEKYTGILSYINNSSFFELNGSLNGFSKFSFIDSLNPSSKMDISTNVKLKDPLYYSFDFTNNKMVYEERVLDSTYIIEEHLDTIKWEITQFTKNILGYNCKSATCELRGRKYIIWYTEDIPASIGPWKFYGLPGLILEAKDNKDIFCFTAKSIENDSITVFNKNPININQTISFPVFIERRKIYFTNFSKMMREKIPSNYQLIINHSGNIDLF
jgi:GLPGLI family protein